ncbi:MAG: ribonuclease HI family protein, partial [Chloroflexia bacterium]
VHAIRNNGGELLRVVVSTPLIVRSERALGITGREATAERAAGPSAPPAPVPAIPDRPAPARPSAEYPPAATARPSREANVLAEPPAPAAEENEEPVPDITGLVKKASEVPAAPRAERRRPLPPEPEPEREVAAEPEPQQAEDDGAPGGLMELSVVFDGGSRGNPGEGYGSFMVQSPNRKPVIKRLEFGDNYTNNQAEYDSLIGALTYIIERLEATNRSPQQVQLDIKSDSDLVVNQLLGAYKVKDAGLKARHAQATELLDRFAAWMINWHERNESVRLLGH